jgi:hypothetical protein
MSDYWWRTAKTVYEANKEYRDVLEDLYASWAPTDAVERLLYNKICRALDKPIAFPEVD